MDPIQAVVGAVLVVGFAAGVVFMVANATSLIRESGNRRESRRLREELDRRLAAGEITSDEYDRARAALDP